MLVLVGFVLWASLLYVALEVGSQEDHVFSRTVKEHLHLSLNETYHLKLVVYTMILRHIGVFSFLYASFRNPIEIVTGKTLHFLELFVDQY